LNLDFASDFARLHNDGFVGLFLLIFCRAYAHNPFS
jgi:hypothetical protein